MGRYYEFGIVALCVLVLDQLTKWLVVHSISPWESVTVIPGFCNLVSVRNRGAAFGFLNRSDIEWQFWLFLFATLAACAAILWLVRTMEETSHAYCIGLGCIFGGALGNGCDRLRLRAVVDFLDLYWKDWHWPAFNVADTAICIGAGLVALVVFLKPRKRLTKS
ncbi:MAG: signal peptidase II [Desulfovibrionaceae bacterium]|nr:signal peptidase II [Desulfovibrionaceae bacterium]